MQFLAILGFTGNPQNFRYYTQFLEKNWHLYVYFLTTLNNVIKEYIMKVVTTPSLFC